MRSSPARLPGGTSPAPSSSGSTRGPLTGGGPRAEPEDGAARRAGTATGPHGFTESSDPVAHPDRGRGCFEFSTNAKGRALAASVLLALAACATPERGAPVDRPDLYVVGDAPIPFAVRQLLPRGVLPSDVRVRANCYGYAAGGTVYPVLNPRGGQYCI